MLRYIAGSLKPIRKRYTRRVLLRRSLFQERFGENGESYLSDQTGRNYIELYPCGHSRVVSLVGLMQNANPEIPEDKTTYVFSNNSRRRFYKKVMSLDCPQEKYLTFFATFTFPHEIRLTYDLNLNKYRLLLKRFYQELSRLGIDSVSKTEFTKKLYPHLHSILILRKETEYVKNYKVGDSDFFDIGKFRNTLINVWCDCVFRYVCNITDIFVVSKMRKASVSAEIIKDWGKTAYYLAKYTSKNDDYQNIIPPLWRGLRFTNKSIRNYPEIKGEIKKISISDDLFQKLALIYVQRVEAKYGKKAYKKSGFYLEDTLDLVGRYFQNSS